MAPSSLLNVMDQNPFNAAPDVAALVEFQHTPDDLMYARNHGKIPRLDADTFTLTVDGDVERPLRFTIDRLKKEFKHTNVVAAIQCAGNRRKVMADKANKGVEGIQWGEGTIANVAWTGVRLRDVLLHAGIELDLSADLHVCFSSHVAEVEQDTWFGSSIPLEKALDEKGDALIAFAMNGHPLHPEHGFPFRIIVPGYSGVRWVKWLDRVTVSNKESTNFYQQRDYKVLPPTVQTHEQAEAWWSKVPALQANPVNSVIAVARPLPSADPASDSDGTVTVLAKGYAVSGLHGQVRAVEVSADQGASWAPAKITYQDGRWSWTLWEAAVRAPAAGKVTLWSRATDEAGEMQKAGMQWNLRGVAYSAVGQYVVAI